MIRGEIEPYRDLATAIVFQAVRDYKAALCDVKLKGIHNSWRLAECERFFASEWCEILSGILRERMSAEMELEKYRVLRS